jgi:hypothetical protein
LLGLLREANHLTLAECRDRLAERTGVRVHPWTGSSQNPFEIVR